MGKLMSDPDRLLPAIWIKGVIVIYAFADPKHVQLAVIEEEKIPVLNVVPPISVAMIYFISS